MPCTCLAPRRTSLWMGWVRTFWEKSAGNERMGMVGVGLALGTEWGIMVVTRADKQFDTAAAWTPNDREPTVS